VIVTSPDRVRLSYYGPGIRGNGIDIGYLTIANTHYNTYTAFIAFITFNQSVAGILCAKRGVAAPAICPDCTLLLRPIFIDETEDDNNSKSINKDISRIRKPRKYW
jgi:hypothetical protein